MLNIRVKPYPKSDGLSILLTTLWNKPNMYVNSSDIKEKYREEGKHLKKGNSINRQLSKIANDPRYEEELGIKTKQKDGFETKFKIQPSIKNLRNASYVIKRQRNLLYSFCKTKGVRKFIKDRLEPLGIKDIDDEMIKNIIIYPSVLKAITKNIDRIEGHIIVFKSSLKEVINSLIITDQILNDNKISQNLNDYFFHKSKDTRLRRCKVSKNETLTTR